MQDCKAVGTPVDVSIKLVKAADNDESVDQQLYQSAILSLLYILVSSMRPDITYAVSTLARFSSEPTKHDRTAVKRVMRYLKGKVNHDIHYSKKGYKNVFATLMQTRQETLMIENQHLTIYFKSVVEMLLGAVRNNHVLLCRLHKQSTLL